MAITDLVYIDSTGYHFSDFPAFLSWLQDQYRAIYGADIYLESDSQDGQFLAVMAKAFYDIASLGGSIYNSFSPVGAQGTGLSRLVKINGLSRLLPSKSTVDLTVVGQSGTVITGGIASDTLQQKWILPTTTIPIGGSILVTATAENEGDVAAAPNTITTIFTPTRGWQSVNNLAAATLGAPVETDAELRIRQTQSTANPSLTVLDGTYGAIANTAGVEKVTIYENDTGSVDANGIPAHSISAVVVGGDSMDIAEAILLHKTPGTRTYGDTPETVYDAHGMPLVIHFQRGVIATVQVEITVAATNGWSNDYIILIQEAVAAVINAVRIGQPVQITKLYAPAYLLGTPAGATFDIATLVIGKNGGSTAAANVDLDWDEYAVCVAADDITVTVT